MLVPEPGRSLSCNLARPSWISFDFHPADGALRRRYSAATAFLYPSRYEGFGLPPLEAMACECPVVTTAAGAVTEYAHHRRNALVVAPGDVRGMADGLEELLLDSDLRAELSAEGVKTAHEYSVARGGPLFRDALMRAYNC